MKSRLSGKVRPSSGATLYSFGSGGLARTTVGRTITVGSARLASAITATAIRMTDLDRSMADTIAWRITRDTWTVRTSGSVERVSSAWPPHSAGCGVAVGSQADSFRLLLTESRII